MHLISFNASPRQVSKLRNGHPVRIKRGTGFNLVVHPENYKLVSRAFTKNKGIQLQLNNKELEDNQDLSPEQHEALGEEMDGNLFQHLPFMAGGSIFKKIKRALHSKGAKKLGRELQPLSREAKSIGREMAHEQIANTHQHMADKYGDDERSSRLVNLGANMAHHKVGGSLGKQIKKALYSKKAKKFGREMQPLTRALKSTAKDLLHEKIAQAHMTGADAYGDDPRMVGLMNIGANMSHQKVGYGIRGGMIDEEDYVHPDPLIRHPNRDAIIEDFVENDLEDNPEIDAVVKKYDPHSNIKIDKSLFMNAINLEDLDNMTDKDILIKDGILKVILGSIDNTGVNIRKKLYSSIPDEDGSLYGKLSNRNKLNYKADLARNALKKNKDKIYNYFNIKEGTGLGTGLYAGRGTRVHGGGMNVHDALKLANLATAHANHQLSKMHNATVHGQITQPPIKRYYDDIFSPPSRGSGLHNHHNLIRGRGSIISQDYGIIPALQSQPYGANFHMQFQLPPQYHKYNDGGIVEGRGLYV